MAYQVFISHAYDHRSIYYELVHKLGTAKSFDWRNNSVQFDMRFEDHTGVQKAEVKKEIAARIQRSEVMLALTKPVAGRREVIQWEINFARELGIPIIGITRQPGDFVSKFVRERSTCLVAWRVDHITTATAHQAVAYRRRLKSIKEREERATAAALGPLPSPIPDVAEHLDPSLLQGSIDQMSAPIIGAPVLPRDVIFKGGRQDLASGSMPLPKPRWSWWPFGRRNQT